MIKTSPWHSLSFVLLLPDFLIDLLPVDIAPRPGGADELPDGWFEPRVFFRVAPPRLAEVSNPPGDVQVGLVAHCFALGADVLGQVAFQDGQEVEPGRGRRAWSRHRLCFAGSWRIAPGAVASVCSPRSAVLVIFSPALLIASAWGWSLWSLRCGCAHLKRLERLVTVWGAQPFCSAWFRVLPTAVFAHSQLILTPVHIRSAWGHFSLASWVVCWALLFQHDLSGFLQCF